MLPVLTTSIQSEHNEQHYVRIARSLALLFRVSKQRQLAWCAAFTGSTLAKRCDVSNRTVSDSVSSTVTVVAGEQARC